MKLEKIRLISLDMDGTILNSQSQVSQENIDVLKRAADAGVEVLINTGRMYNSARFFNRDTGLNVPMITANGAAIFDRQGTRLRHCPLPAQASRAVVDIAEEFGAYYHGFINNTLCSRRADKQIQFYLDLNARLPEQERVDIQIWDREKMIAGCELGFSKFLIMEPDIALIERIRARLQGIEGLNLSSSGITNIEIVAAGVDKGEALAWYSAKKGIPMGAVMAMGDSENDLDMLKAAGWSVAMGNASDLAINASRFRTAHHDLHGVALAIRHFVFGEDVGDLDAMAAQAASIHGEVKPI